jgi:TonB family protein
LKLEPVYNAPRPSYSLVAQRQHLEGTRLMEIHIKPNGSVESVRVLKTTGYRILDQAAIADFVNGGFALTASDSSEFRYSTG